MATRKTAVLFLLSILSFTAPALLGQSSPCRKTEPAPSSRESNPTVRDPIVGRVSGPAGARTISAEACLVVGTGQNTHPGGDYPVPAQGLYFDWNLALVGKAGRLIDTFGTIANTGQISANPQPSLSQSLVAGWTLGPGQPNPSTGQLFSTVAVRPCKNQSGPCVPDQSGEFFVTRLLSASGAENDERADRGPTDKNQPGCLAPVTSGKDFELRQLTVVAFAKNQYRIFGCLVSNKYASFKAANFNVLPLDSKDQPTAATPGGNTRQNIGPLYASGGRHPRLVTLLAVQITASNPNPVTSAATTVTFTGCAKPDETSCSPQVQKTWKNFPVTFVHAGN